MRRAFTRPSGTIRNRLGLLTQLFHARPADPLETTERPADAFDAVWRAKAKSRVLIVLSVIVLWGVGVEARLVMLQAVDHAEYKARAATQQITTVEELPLRGDLVDRHGALLAYSTDAHRIMGFPLQARDAGDTVDQLCDALADCTTAERDTWLTRFAGKKPFTIRFARTLTEPQADRVAAAKIDGIVLEDQSLRSYPMGDLASHVLGFVGIDNVGLAGLEHTYDRLIQGQPGKLLVEWDAKHNWIETRMEQKSVAGATLELDDRRAVAARRGARAGRGRRAQQGAGRCGRRDGSEHRRDSRDGELSGFRSEPLRPGDARRSHQPRHAERLRTRLDVQDGDRVGGDPGRRHPDDRPDRHGAGLHQDSDRARRSATRRTRTGRTISFEDVIVHSSNVGAIKVGLRVGADRLSQYVHRFGFGQIAVARLSGTVRRRRLGGRQDQRQRARVDVDGLSGRRDAAADGHGRERRRQRRHAV